MPTTLIYDHVNIIVKVALKI